jgi:type I restriction enzyme M protein
MLAPTARKAVWSAVSERDATAEPVRNAKGAPEPDPALRESEKVPLVESVDDYLNREVLHFVPDAWVPEPEGRIGYELPFTKLFYRYQPASA